MSRVMPLIETNVIPDGAVYGVPQVSYTVGDVSGRDFTGDDGFFQNIISDLTDRAALHHRLESE